MHPIILGLFFLSYCYIRTEARCCPLEKKSNFNNPTRPLAACSITMVNNTPYVTEHAPFSVTLPMAHSCLSCWEGSRCSVHSSVELVSSTGVHLTPLCTWTHACQWQCVLWSFIDDLALIVGLSTIPPWGSGCSIQCHELENSGVWIQSAIGRLLQLNNVDNKKETC